MAKPGSPLSAVCAGGTRITGDLIFAGTGSGRHATWFRPIRMWFEAPPAPGTSKQRVTLLCLRFRGPSLQGTTPGWIRTTEARCLAVTEARVQDQAASRVGSFRERRWSVCSTPLSQLLTVCRQSLVSRGLRKHQLDCCLRLPVAFSVCVLSLNVPPFYKDTTLTTSFLLHSFCQDLISKQVHILRH